MKIEFLQYPVLSTLIGVITGFLLSELKEYFKTRRLNNKRRVIAYRRLKGILERIVGKYPITEAKLSDDELEKIEDTLANFCDVIDDSTLESWDLKKVLSREGGHFIIDIGQFFEDIRIHYDRFKRDNPSLIHSNAEAHNEQ